MTADSEIYASEVQELSGTKWKEATIVLLLVTTTFGLGLILFVRPEWLI